MATLAMVGFCAVYYGSQRLEFVLDAPEEGKQIMARNGARAMAQALERVLRDADAQSFHSLFSNNIQVGGQTVPAMLTRHTRLARGLLTRGASFAALREDVAVRLERTYFEVRPDPWGRPYQVLFDPAERLQETGCWPEDSYAALWAAPVIVFSLGPDGLTDLGTGASACDDIFAAGPVASPGS